jgi:hypothetical protein
MNNMDHLLEKYFEGETSLQEESLIRTYFQQGKIADHHQVYAPMFAFFSQERQEAAPIAQRKRKIPLFVWASVAASIVLLISVRLFFSSEEVTPHSVVYVNGVKMSDSQTINSEALNSIQSISHIDGEVMNSQIGILDSFTE